MEQRKFKGRTPAPHGQTEHLLASYYRQLAEWALALTRGDKGKAEELVQEFCLYFSLTKPDLTAVANLDGYLYTCLRHIYLSSLARSSREAMRFISVAEFDSFEFAAAASRSGDLLQTQNDLRRACGYAVWRKESFKGASYFILHFFHGYTRGEIAALARLPLSAIYNKLKIGRSEVRSYIDEPGKLRIVGRGRPPEPRLAWGLSSPFELFRELRETILRARASVCLPEEELLAHYRSPLFTPIDCPLLAHIVSCERCLAVIDRYFNRPTLTDREPLDGSSSDPGSPALSARGPMDYEPMMRAVRRRMGRTWEHRPQTLSIAVNGKIVAFHDVQAEHSTLSARIDYPGSAEFVEAFSEQDVRLALLSIEDSPPEGPHSHTQHVELSDGRWLELSLTFDGLGLNGEVVYFDPALASESLEEPAHSVAVLEPARDSARSRSKSPGIAAALARLFGWLAPSSAMAWAVTLMLMFGAAGYLIYRYNNAPMDATEVLNRAVQVETASLLGQTEHQVLKLSEVAANGQVVQRDTVDLWRDGDGSRTLRRLYDDRHRLIAAEWRNRYSRQGPAEGQWSRSASRRHAAAALPELWNEDLSAGSFRTLTQKAPEIQRIDGGYRFTATGPAPGQPELVSATLFLNNRLQPVREVLRIREGAGVHELRLMQADFERQPSRSVPDAVFDPGYAVLHSSQEPRASIPHDRFAPVAGSDLQLAQLQIAVLYQLNLIGADTGQPIEVIRTPEGRVLVSGTIADPSLRQEIVSRLQALADHRLLDVRLVSAAAASGQHRAAHSATVTSVYDVDQAAPAIDVPLREYLRTRKLSGKQLDAAAAQYSRDALQLAQHALQHAYALDRLGSALSTAELTSIDPPSQRQWTMMVTQHAIALQNQFELLRKQLAEIVPSGIEVPAAGEMLPAIDDPAQFARAAAVLLARTQELNRDVGELFTSNSSEEPAQDQALLPVETMRAIPWRQSEEIARFASQLNASSASASLGGQNSGTYDGAPAHQPR